MSANSESFPPPNNPDDFESLCLDLWKDIWRDQGAQKNGRSGQSQAGVDVYGRQDGHWIGVQCKQKNGLIRSKVTAMELEREVHEALQFEPKLTAFILATTGPADVKVQQRARELTEEHRAKGLFTIEVWSWERTWHEIYGREELLRRIGPVYWPRHWRLIEERLKVAGQKLKCVFAVQGAVPQPPPHYLLRAKLLADLRRYLLDTDAASLAITGQGAVAVQGMGGVGKTVLAAALTRDLDVQRVFPDGIFWLTLGQQPNLLAVMNQLASWLPDCDGPLNSEPKAQSTIRHALAGKRALLILDDVWHLDHAAALNLVSAPGRLLVTTRKREVMVALGAQEFCVDALSLPEALRMLADWAGVKDPALLPPQATDVAQKCGRLPLALAMIGAMVQLRPTAWPDALEFLRSRDLEEFRRAFPDYPYPDLLRAIAVSVDELPPDDRERYLDLAVFPEDEPIPEGPLQVLWGLTPAKTRACMGRFAARSLATVQQVGGRTALLLHDLQGDYLRKQREQTLPALHTRLLNTYAARCEIQEPAKWPSGPNDGYFFERIAWHLRQAGREEELRSLLLDFAWLQAKLRTTCVQALLVDFDQLPGDLEVLAARVAIWQSAQILDEDENQLSSQLVGRLLRGASASISDLLAAACRWRGGPWLRPLNGSLQSHVLSLNGHSGSVNAVSVASDSQLAVSGSEDRTVRVWNIASGSLLFSLDGHAGTVSAVAVTPDGRLAISASEDRTIKLWDLEQRREVLTLKGHTQSVTSVAISQDAHIALSGSADRTVRLWDLVHGKELGKLTGHGDVVMGVGLTPDGSVGISCSHDKTVKVWNLKALSEARTLYGHSDLVCAVVVSPDGRQALSASCDKSLILWDLETGLEKRRLLGHGSYVRTLSVASNWRVAVSGAIDNSLRVWDLENGETLRVLAGHSNCVMTAAIFDRGRQAISGSRDKTLKVWNLQAEVDSEKPQSHGGLVTSVTIYSEGRRAISSAGDGTLMVWDLNTMQNLQTRQAHEGCIMGVAVSLGDRRAISGGHDGTIRMWDLDTLREVSRSGRETTGIASIAMSLDGRTVVSGLFGNKTKVWKVDSEDKLRVLVEHDFKLVAVAILKDGLRAVSVSFGGKVRVWDLHTGQTLLCLEGAQAWSQMETTVFVPFAVSPGERWVTVGRERIIEVWGLKTGRKIRTLRIGRGVVTWLAWAPDGRSVLAASSDGVLRIWDLERRGVTVRYASDNVINHCAFAPDHRTIVAGDWAGRIHFLRLVLPDDPVGVSGAGFVKTGAKP